MVWREYGKFRDRVPLMVTGSVLYGAVAVSVELIGPHRLLGTFPYIFDAACFVAATLPGLVMTGPHAYTAAGATWLARKYGRRNPNRGRYRTMKLPEVVRVDSVKRYGAWGMGKTTVVRFLRADERRIFIDLKTLERCPPMVAVIDRALFETESRSRAGCARRSTSPTCRSPPGRYDRRARRTVTGNLA